MSGDIYERVDRVFQDLMQARHQFASLRAPVSAPAWLDKESCRRGRDFYNKNVTAISLSSMEALLLGMCIPNFYKPLIFSRKSHNVKDSKARYLETAAIVFSWYQADCWERESLASLMMRRVNAMHRFVAGRVRPINDNIDENVKQVFHEADIDCEAELTEQDRILLAEIEAIREKTDIPQEYYDYVNDSSAFSQVDMCLVQGAFFGQYLLYPDHYGGKSTRKEDIENFLMFWRTNGYYLGIEDSYNAVLENFEETKLLGQLVMERLLKPCMLHLDPQAMHMAKAALFPMMDYHVVLYDKYELVGYDLPKLWASFSLLQRARYYLRHIYIPYIYPLPGIKDMANWISLHILNKVLTKYRNKGFGSNKTSQKKNNIED